MQGELAPAMKTFQGKLAKVRFPLEKISPSAKEKSTSLEIFSQFYFLKSCSKSESKVIWRGTLEEKDQLITQATTPAARRVAQYIFAPTELPRPSQRRRIKKRGNN